MNRDEPPKSNLFLIRLWSNPTEGIAESEGSWQGRIQPIGEGRAAAFSDWPTLRQVLEEMLHNPHDEKMTRHNDWTSDGRWAAGIGD